jgi:hypothetical protein
LFSAKCTNKKDENKRDRKRDKERAVRRWGKGQKEMVRPNRK